ncbi:ABC transporter ATP-binding protein [Jeotgalibacillus campisalis]|uniref:Bacitracin ABC transporter ATP-binding protein n=1 Tax=Jeotgalibacillus campisalis TaxID=220754 RepID=A0A0C2VGT8_9BACL|nr:ABC transporter ATP-binding protein [Jeotgalibacillus campisalis]KIL48082.1 bacitracin ABC transporter ATP-binding protein [Jeotgalibacillus campisalis]
MKTVVEIINVKKRIGKKEVIHGISTKLFPGEVFGFLGPNGAGKTTMIRMMVGLTKVSEGQILINGHCITTDFEKAVRHVGGIIENPEMYKHLTGYENLRQYERLFPEKLPEDRVNEVIKLVGLEKRIHEKVKNYSLGMRQRLGIAQALLHKPSLLILDEPTNGLDPAGIREIRQYIRRIAKEEQMAVFVSSHLLSEMQLMCDKIGIIQNGNLIRVEKTETLIHSRTQEVFIDASPIEKVQELLNNYSCGKTDEGIIVRAEKEELPELIHQLSRHQVKVYEFTPLRKTLEDSFLQMTEEDQHVYTQNASK